MQKFEQIFINGIADFSQIRVKRIHGTKERGISGVYRVKGPITNSYKYKVTFYKKQGGEYRLMPYNSPLAPWCSTYDNDPYIIPDLVKHSNLTQPLECPFSNVSFDWFY
jgi:hypothetical protein